MDKNLTLYDNADEDYIDIEVSSSPSTYFSYPNSPPHPREFEFQKSSTSLEIEPTTSPADELFYKGNLLPLHLPPRLQMVQKLLQNSTKTSYDNKTEPFDDRYTTSFTTTNTTTTTTTTPFESCNISPSSSCRVSRELNPDEFFFDCTTDVSGVIGDQPKKAWSKKLKLIKQSSLGMKLKASRAYLKSLFTKTRCSDQAFAQATNNAAEDTTPKEKECLKKHMKAGNKYPFGQIHMERYQVADAVMEDTNVEDSGTSTQRRSFSLTIKKHSSTKSISFSSSGSSSSSSSSSSANSKGFYEIHLLKRCNSENSEIENSIQGAIAHCKKSQQAICSRKNVTEVGFCSFSASKTCEDQVRPGLCRG